MHVYVSVYSPWVGIAFDTSLLLYLYIDVYVSFDRSQEGPVGSRKGTPGVNINVGANINVNMQTHFVEYLISIGAY